MLGAQADLIPDGLVTVVGERACSDIEAVVSGEITVTPFAGPGVLRCAADAASGVAGRLSSDVAGRLLAALDRRLGEGEGTHAWTDQAHLQMLVAIAAGDDDENAAAAFDRISRLLALESPSSRARAQPIRRSTTTAR